MFFVESVRQWGVALVVCGKSVSPPFLCSMWKDMGAIPASDKKKNLQIFCHIPWAQRVHK